MADDFNDLYLNPSTHDLVIENGDFKTVKGQEAIGQNVKQRLLTFLEEWFLDQTLGVNWPGLFEPTTRPQVIETVLKAEIRNTPGIVEVIEFDADIDVANYQLQIAFKAQSVEGEIEYNDILRLT